MSAPFPDPIPAHLAVSDDRSRRIAGTLCCDFANSRVGARPDMFEHRIRLLYRLTARRDRARAVAAPGRPA